MTIYRVEALSEFSFKGGAADTAADLTESELNLIEEQLMQLSPEGMTEYEVNWFMWRETETIAEWLGYKSYENLLNDAKYRKSPK